MKKVCIIGVGAQGSTIAKRLNEDPNVSEIICADYDQKMSEEPRLIEGKDVYLIAVRANIFSDCFYWLH